MTRFLLAGMLAALSAAVAGPALAGDKNLVVVELFTSQGCSSCPPANANLVKLAKRSDVLALSFSVTYWDRLGWKDIFGKPEFTDRQAVYEPSLGETGPFTPQMVIGGRASIVGQNLSEVESRIAAARRGGGPNVTLKLDDVTVGAGETQGGAADVWLVRFDPGVVEVPVKRGENSGRTLAHANVVHELRRLGGWSGKPVTLAVPRGREGLKVAILVQGPGGGPVLSAATE